MPYFRFKVGPWCSASLTGTDRNDSFDTGGGNISIDGKNGTDTIIYSNKNLQIIAYLNESKITKMNLRRSNEASYDTFSNIEIIIASPNNDIIYATDAFLEIDGKEGFDSIIFDYYPRALIYNDTNSTFKNFESIKGSPYSDIISMTTGSQV